MCRVQGISASAMKKRKRTKDADKKLCELWDEIVKMFDGEIH